MPSPTVSYTHLLPCVGPDEAEQPGHGTLVATLDVVVLDGRDTAVEFLDFLGDDIDCR